MRGVRFALIAAVFATACGSGRPAEDASRAALHLPTAAAADPTLRPARLVPLRAADNEENFGSEPGGGKRALVAGVRVVRLVGGGIQSASDPMPTQSPPQIIELPERLGGGFLFGVGQQVYRSDSWLAPLQIVYRAALQPTSIFVGLDRVYARLSNGAHAAFDPRTGAPMDLGPWPTSPDVTHYVAADGWRAVAIADLRGVVATFDAGAKWQTLPIPIQATELRLSGEAIVVSGMDAQGIAQTYAVQPNGQVAHLATDEHVRVHPKTQPVDAEKQASKNPLVAAVLDGWPLEGGAALVARDGELWRIRVSDGTVLDKVVDAFPLKPARCHSISLAPPKTPAAFGFVCGVQHGATELYAYDAHSGKLVTLKHFDSPRAVFSAGNGTLVVEGTCDAEAAPADVKKTEQAYCLMHRDRSFEDFVVNGDVGTERVVPLIDGRTAIISPPVGDIATARLTIFDGKKPTTIPIAFDDISKTPTAATTKKRNHDDDDDDDDDHAGPDDDAITTAILRSGTWLRGVEERAPGVLSVWVEHSGHYVGVELNVNGHAKHGKYIAELGTAIVSGRYGLGWSASRAGYETIDGGMTWTPLALPEPLESNGPASGATTHGCGPLGCVLAGWIRVGWTPVEETSATDASQSPKRVDLHSPESLSIKCELATPKPSLPSTDVSGPAQYSSYGYGNYGRRYGSTAPVSQDWSAFFTIEPPKLATDDLGFSRPIDDMYERNGNDRSSPGRFSVSRVARLYAWGPKGIDWDTHGRFMVRFTSPFESSSQMRATQTMTTPSFIGEATTFLGGSTYYPPHGLTHIGMIPGDDAAHALLVIHRAQSIEPVILELEGERAPSIVHRPDSQAIGDVESGVRMNGHWYIATSEGLATTVVWEIEGGVAREVVRLPRTPNNATSRTTWAVRLVRRADNHMLGAMLEGTPITEGAATPSTWASQLYALPIDVGAGSFQDPERLGTVNGTNKSVHVCGPEDGGWIVDGRWPGGTITLSSTTGTVQGSSSSGMFARYRVSLTSMCIEKISTTGYGETTGMGTLGKIDKPTVDVGMYVDRARQSFRCVSSR